MFVVAYGPQEDADCGEKNVFWCAICNELTKVRNAYPGATVILFIDANAKVGSITCSAIGGASADPENDNGGRLRLFCCEQRLTVVNTFIGSGSTWSGLLGDRHRIDYVATGTASVSRVRFCSATPEVDISTFRAARYDHNPVVADVSLAQDECSGDIMESFSHPAGAPKQRFLSTPCPPPPRAVERGACQQPAPTPRLLTKSCFLADILPPPCQSGSKTSWG